MKYSLLVALVLSGTVAWAGTRDGRTPAEERVCDPLKRGTPGLYGMCVSFCEARDLDELVATGAKNPDKLQRALAKRQDVLDRYDARRRPGDPEMPCMSKAACPCWGSQQTSTSFWTSRSSAPQCLSSANSVSSLNRLSGGGSQSKDIASIMSMRFPQSNDPVNLCIYQDQQTGTQMMQQINASDALVCETHVQATCNVLGQ